MPAYAELSFVLMASLAAAVLMLFGARRLAVVACAAAAFFCCALQWTSLLWSTEQDGERLRAEVVVDSLVTLREHGIEFDAWVDVQHPVSVPRRLRARIVWRAPPRPWPAAGERWQLLLQMHAPQAALGASTSSGRDPARDAFRDDIHARATVVGSNLNQRMTRATTGLLVWRARIERALQRLVPDRATAALFAGLAVGATGAISREQWQVFSVTGTTHLVAISGMHVTLFAWLMAALARRVWSAWPMLQRRFRREFFAGVLGVCAAGGYALMAGFGVPTQRTLVMLACWWWAKLSGREQRGYEVLGCAMLLILIVDPRAPLSSGFWLSFIAMATLLAGDLSLTPRLVAPRAASRWRRLWDASRTWWRETAHTQWRVTLALTPVTLAWFSGFSLAGLLANFVAIPVFSFVLVPLVLAASAVQELSEVAARVLLWPACLAWQGLWPVLQALTNLPFAKFSLGEDAWLWIVSAPVIFLWLWPVPWRWRAVASLCLWPWVWPARATPDVGTAQVSVLAAGDGVAVLVRTHEHALLYETGESYGSRGRRIDTLVVPALRTHGIETLDLLVLGRAGSSNVAGAVMLLQRELVPVVRAGGRWSDPPPRVGACRSRERWQWDGVTFDLFPAREALDTSCVLRIAAYGGGSLLLGERIDGDESRALAAQPLVRDVEVLLAPRRGSSAATDVAFVAATRPQRVLVATGRFDDAQRARIAQHWQIAPACVWSTAEGAIDLLLRPRRSATYTQVAASAGARLWRREPTVGYDSGSLGAETARCGN